MRTHQPSHLHPGVIHMHVECFTFNVFQTNCYVCSSGKDAIVIDPAAGADWEHETLRDYIDQEGLQLRCVVLTHAHIDHILGLARLCEERGISFVMHRSDLPLLHNAEMQARMFAIEFSTPSDPDSYLAEGDHVEFGDVRLEVLHTPGHSPGSISLVERSENVVLGGDVLFQGSIGRTDLWQGSLPVLMQSIYGKMLPLGDDVRVYPGHGPSTTIGAERKTNPFLTGTYAVG